MDIVRIVYQKVGQCKEFATVQWTLQGVSLLQKWGAIHQPQSLQDFKNEISSLHFNDSPWLKLFHYNIIM